MIPANSSLQGSSVTTVGKPHSVTCTQHDTSATTAVVSASSISFEIETSWPVDNQSITGGQENSVVATGKGFYRYTYSHRLAVRAHTV